MSEIAESFESALSELTVNSKPHINMLTMLSDDHLDYAPIITQTVFNHLQKVSPEVKLPTLYLIDSIVKNVGKAYINLINQHIALHFANTFEAVDEKTREQMFKLRQTWSDIFPAKTLHTLDSKVHQIDPAWPVSAPPPTILLNPKFFKKDVVDSKSLTTTINHPGTQQTESRAHKKTSKPYTPRSSSLTQTSRSKKTSSGSTSGQSGDGKASLPAKAESQQTQVYIKHKMLLELQQQKLKLKLLQTQAQLEEQQKQLEKQTTSHKSTATSAELSLLQEQVKEEEKKIKMLTKNLKKQGQMRQVKQDLHRTTSRMKAEKLTDFSKLAGPESLVKPAALLELTEDKAPKPLLKSVVTKTKPIPASERLKLVSPSELTEEVSAPVRIAPVSSQLISAALTFGRNVRDPRIRQMSSRIENQVGNVTAPPSLSTAPLTVPPPLNRKPLSEPDQEAKSKKPSPKKDKKTNSQFKDKHLKISDNLNMDNSSKVTEENTKHLRSSNRSIDKSPSKKSEKSSPKRSDGKNSKKSKVEDLFSNSKSKSPHRERTEQDSHLPSKSFSKKDQIIPSDASLSKVSNVDQISNIQSSPKKTKQKDNNQSEILTGGSLHSTESMKLPQKLSIDTAKAKSLKESETVGTTVSPEPMDSAEMLNEDMEQIVRNPVMISKIVKFPDIPMAYDDELFKSSDDSLEDNFEDIIRNPTKLVKFDKITRADDLKSTKPGSLEVTGSEKLKQSVMKMSNENNISNDVSVHNVQISHKQSVGADNVFRSNLTEPRFSKVIPSVPMESAQQTVHTHVKDPRLLNQKEDENTPELDRRKFNDEIVSKGPTSTNSRDLNAIDPEIAIDSTKLVSDNGSINELENSHEQYISSDLSICNHEKLDSTDAHQDITSLFDIKLDSNVAHQDISSLFDISKPIEQPMSEQLSQLLLPQYKPEFSNNVTFSDRSSPKRPDSPVTSVEPMDIIEESNENISIPTEISLSKKQDRRQGSPVQEERKVRKGEKSSIAEQIIADAEKHEASPSPPPPSIISDKFKEIKQSSLSRLRTVGRPRENQEDSESPEPSDVDLRTQSLPPTLTKDLKNEVLGLAEKDVDLRNLVAASPTKKRPSMDNMLDVPPPKKTKSEAIDELFGSEDVDLRPVLCPPPPSPPPPPIISGSGSPPPTGDTGARMWARYKQTRPDTYKSSQKYTPTRRDRGFSVDKFGRPTRLNSYEGSVRNRTYSEDVDMRAQPPGTDSDYNHILMQALEQHKRGDLNDSEYRRVLSEVFSMREKQQLEEAQRLDEVTKPLEVVSDEEFFSGDSLSGLEDAPSPTESYSGGEEAGESSRKKHNEKHKPSTNDPDSQSSENMGDVDIRMPPGDVDIRIQIHQPRKDEDKSLDERSHRKSRGVSPYGRKSSSTSSEKDNYRRRRDEMRAQRKEKKSRRAEEEEERRAHYGKSRYGQEAWSDAGPNKMEVDARVPPLPHYREPVAVVPTRFPDLPEQKDSPPLRPPIWEPQRMASPSPWMPGMAPLPRGPPLIMGIRPQERFMPPNWRQPGPGLNFDGDPTIGPLPRFPPRFGPPGPLPMDRFPLVPCEVPPTDPVVLKAIEDDPTKSISIDGVPRDIRFYGKIAVAFMNWDDPREVCFQPGARHIIIDDQDSMLLHFNQPPVEMFIDGQPHNVCFGAPTRELFIDNQWFEVFFGGAPVICDIKGHRHTVKLEGPPPQIRPGVQRRDLVVGKVTLIIDAEMIFTVYLDAKPQKFEVDGISYIIRFVEAFQKTVINGVAFISDFGGKPKPIILNGKKHYFRLTALPRGVTPGYHTILNMEGGRLPSPPPCILPAPPQLPASLEQAMEFKRESFLQPPPPLGILPPITSPPDRVKRELETASVHPPALPLPIITAPLLTKVQSTPHVNPLDMLTTMMPVMEPNRAAVDYSYSVDNENSNPSSAPPTTTGTTTLTTDTSSLPTLTGEINVAELLQKLMATGIMPSLDQAKDKVKEKPVVPESSLIRPVDFRKPETMKTRQSALIAHLYSGIQCNSCGVRFPPEQTLKYSQHLDWHFRQNRRDRDSTRTVMSRRYYYDVNDWVQFEEIEDLEERAQPWFDMQEGVEEEEQPPREVVSVRAADYPEDAQCEICHDKFESFYNDEKEEWHLRNAAHQDGKLVHPLCLEDEKAAAEKPIILDDIDITEDEPKEEEVKVEEKKSKEEEDDDIMEVKDIEFVKPVFPVEDLTVSDSESVADNDEKPDVDEDAKGEVEIKDHDESLEITEITISDNKDIKDDLQDKSEIKEQPNDDEVKKDEETEPKDEVMETEDEQTEINDDESQDNVVLLDKGEDSVLSTAEILEVVRNIKKDPDALGGEFDEGQDPDIKKEKGAVPLPEPIVDTTHASVVCSIDGNVELEDTPQQVSGGPPKIKITITKPVVPTAAKDIKESDELEEITGAEPPNSTMAATLALNSQPYPPGEEPVPLHTKPKLIGRKLQDLPPVLKGSELSGLCSIM